MRSSPYRVTVWVSRPHVIIETPQGPADPKAWLVADVEGHWAVERWEEPIPDYFVDRPDRDHWAVFAVWVDGLVDQLLRWDSTEVQEAHS